MVKPPIRHRSGWGDVFAGKRAAAGRAAFFMGWGWRENPAWAAGERARTGDAGQASSACRAARSEAARGKAAKPGMRAAQPTAAAMTRPRALESAPRRREMVWGFKNVRMRKT